MTSQLPDLLDDDTQPPERTSKRRQRSRTGGPTVLKTRASRGGAIAAALLAVAALVAVVTYVLNTEPETSEPAVAATSEDVVYESAAAAVTAYLNALAASDAEAALAILTSEPADTTLLTSSMLAASTDLAPMSDIVVEEPAVTEADSVDVAVSYRLGTTTIDSTVRAVRDSNFLWTVLGITTMAAPPTTTGLDLTLNGIDIDDPDEMVLFPGTYELATTTPSFTITGTTRTYLSLDEVHPGFDDAEPALDDEGLTHFRDVIGTAVATCVESSALDPGCGVAITSSPTDELQPIDGTVAWVLSAQAQATLSQLQPELSPSNPFAVSAGAIGPVEVELECNDVTNDTLTTCSPSVFPIIGFPVVDFSTSPATVLW